jgi:hypothetical protein
LYPVDAVKNEAAATFAFMFPLWRNLSEKIAEVLNGGRIIANDP